MGAKYWIKLYHEILRDPKMVRLRDRLWRRAIECFLLAGEEDKAGHLPSTDDMAFHFRCDAEQLETELVELSSLGIVSQMGGRWMVTKFEIRQDAMKKAEFMRRLRDERKKEEYYQPVTPDVTEPVTNSNTDKIRIDKKRIEERSHTSRFEHIPEETTELINALATHTTADILLDAEPIRDIAEAFAEEGVTAEQIAGFPAWWDEEGKQAKKNNKKYPYIGRPALKSLRRHWPEYVNGTTASAPVPDVDFKVFQEAPNASD